MAYDVASGRRLGPWCWTAFRMLLLLAMLAASSLAVKLPENGAVEGGSTPHAERLNAWCTFGRIMPSRLWLARIFDAYSRPNDLSQLADSVGA